MKRTVKSAIKANMLMLVTLAILPVSLTACQKGQTVKNEQGNPSSVATLKKQEKKTEKVTVAKPILQEEVTFKEPIVIKETASVSVNEPKYAKDGVIFLEVAPKTEHCSSGINQQCLKVRDIYLDKNWIQSGTGDWRLMTKAIKGYKHNPQYKKVLRVKKRIIDSPDSKGKQLSYELEVVVKSEVAE